MKFLWVEEADFERFSFFLVHADGKEYRSEQKEEGLTELFVRVIVVVATEEMEHCVVVVSLDVFRFAR